MQTERKRSLRSTNFLAIAGSQSRAELRGIDAVLALAKTRFCKNLMRRARGAAEFRNSDAHLLTFFCPYGQILLTVQE